MKKIFSITSFTFYLFFLLIGLPVFFIFIKVIFFNATLFQDLKQLGADTLFLLMRSVALAGLTALFSTLIGSVLGFVLYRTKWRNYGLLKIILLIPLFISPYIWAVAWRDFFSLISINNQLIYSFWGVVLVLVIVFTPLSMLITGTALSNLNRALEESALMLADEKKVITGIVLPLIRPALFSSFVLVFIFSISNFSVPAFLGVRVFTTEIFTQFSAFYNHELAVLQSVLLVVVCVVLLVSEFRYISDAPFLSVGNKGNDLKIYTGKKYALLGAFAVFFWLLLSVVLPLFVLLKQSFTGDSQFLLKAWELLKPTLFHSMSLALISSLFIIFIGMVVGYSQWRKRKTRLFNGVLLLVFTIPSTVYGISLIKFYNTPILNFIYSGFGLLVIALVGKFSFIAVKIIANSMHQVPESMREAALLVGIPEFRIFSGILLPLILPAVFAAFTIVFIFTLGDLGTSIMIYPPGIELLPVKVFTVMANAPQSLTSSMSLVVFSVTLLVVAFLFLIYKLIIRLYRVDY